MDITEIIQSGINGFIDHSWTIVTALAAVGIFSMALIEIIKLLFQPRWFFNKFIFRSWLKKIDLLGAEPNILKLATGGSAYLLYSLPIERMAGQINAAAQVALAYPTRYPAILRALGRNSDVEDIEMLIDGLSEDTNPQDYANARNRVSNMIQRNLDALQILIDGLWTRLMQSTAVVVSMTVILYLILYAKPGETNYTGALVYAFIGGMIAPVAKDILTQLTAIKNRPR